MVLPRLASKKRFNRIVSILLVHTFLLSNVAFGSVNQDNKQYDSSKEPEINLDPNKVVVQRDYGLVKSRFVGKDKKLIIHIQDAHCNFEAQTNITKILEALIKNYGLSLVSVEGADGFIDTTWFKAFPDEEVRKEVATYFMKKGEITGPEFLSITTDYPIKLFGAETRSYYIQNLNAFTTSYPLKDDTERYYNQIKTVLNRLKNYIYSEDLKTLDAKIQDYEAKKLQFTDYVKYLQSLAEKHRIKLRGYENLFKLVSVLIYEQKINFNMVDKERTQLIDTLTKKLEKAVLTELVNQSLSFKVGKISSAEYYNYLRKLASKYGITLVNDYPNLFNYIIYNSVYSKIENEKLFKDIKDLERAIKEKLFGNDDQRTLDRLSYHIDILLGLVNIKLLNGDFDYYLANKEGFSHEAFAAFIKKMSERYGFAYEVEPPYEAVKESMPKLVDFYEIAIKRDKALVDNTLQAMRKEGVQVSVLVTGGFHSEGITKLLENRGISYIVVCPNITKEAETPYIKILTNQRTPLEEILSDTGAAATDATGVRKGMLAAISRAMIVPLERNELAALLRNIPDVDPKLIRDIIENAGELKGDWEELAIQVWMERVIVKERNNPALKDVDAMKRKYIDAVEDSLKRAYLSKNRSTAEGAEPQLTRAQNIAIGRFKTSLKKSPEFNEAFSTVHNRIFASTGDAAPGTPGTHMAKKKQGWFSRVFGERIPRVDVSDILKDMDTRYFNRKYVDDLGLSLGIAAFQPRDKYGTTHISEDTARLLARELVEWVNGLEGEGIRPGAIKDSDVVTKAIDIVFIATHKRERALQEYKRVLGCFKALLLKLSNQEKRFGIVHCWGHAYLDIGTSHYWVRDLIRVVYEMSLKGEGFDLCTKYKWSNERYADDYYDTGFTYLPAHHSLHILEIVEGDIRVDGNGNIEWPNNDVGGGIPPEFYEGGEGPAKPAKIVEVKRPAPAQGPTAFDAVTRDWDLKIPDLSKLDSKSAAKNFTDRSWLYNFGADEAAKSRAGLKTRQAETVIKEINEALRKRFRDMKNLFSAYMIGRYPWHEDANDVDLFLIVEGERDRQVLKGSEMPELKDLIAKNFSRLDKRLPPFELNIEIVGIETLRKAAAGEKVEAAKVLGRRLLLLYGSSQIYGADIYKLSRPHVEDFKLLMEDLRHDATIDGWPDTQALPDRVQNKIAWRNKEADALEKMIEVYRLVEQDVPSQVAIARVYYKTSGEAAPEKPAGPGTHMAKKAPVIDITRLIEAQKDAYARLAGAENRDAGYKLSIARLDSFSLSLPELINDPIVVDAGAGELVAKLIAFGKGSVFRFWKSLSAQKKKDLIKQLSGLDIEMAEHLHYRFNVKHESRPNIGATAENISVPPVYDLRAGAGNKDNTAAKPIGEKAFQDGAVAVMEVAGGSGQRLGYDHPKGMFGISPVMQKSLFRLRAEKIAAMAAQYGKPVPWIIMTSDITHDETVKFFEENKKDKIYFGAIPEDWVIMVRQRVLPQVTDTGEYIIDESQYKVIIGGFGHGDATDYVLNIKQNPTLIKRLKMEFGVNYIMFVQVDNAMMAGPTALGYHIQSRDKVPPGTEHMSNVVVEKAGPAEKVGMALLKDGATPFVMEYSQVPDDIAYYPYIYILGGERVIFVKDDSNAYRIVSESDFVKLLADAATTYLKLCRQHIMHTHIQLDDPLINRYRLKWIRTHCLSLDDLPEDATLQFARHSYAKSELTKKAKLWLGLGSINVLIFTLDTLIDNAQNPLPPLVARKDTKGFDPVTGEYGKIGAAKFEIFIFERSLVGKSTGAYVITGRSGEVFDNEGRPVGAREGGFAPFKNPVPTDGSKDVDNANTAAEIIAEHDRLLLRAQGWEVSPRARVELTSRFAFFDGRYLGAKLKGKGRIGDGALYLSGTNTTIGRGLNIDSGSRIAIDVRDEYNPDTQVKIGNNVTVNMGAKVNCTIYGSGRLIIDDDAVLSKDTNITVDGDNEVRITKFGGIIMSTPPAPGGPGTHMAKKETGADDAYSLPLADMAGRIEAQVRESLAAINPTQRLSLDMDRVEFLGRCKITFAELEKIRSGTMNVATLSSLDALMAAVREVSDLLYYRRRGFTVEGLGRRITGSSLEPDSKAFLLTVLIPKKVAKVIDISTRSAVDTSDALKGALEYITRKEIAASPGGMLIPQVEELRRGLTDSLRKAYGLELGTALNGGIFVYFLDPRLGPLWVVTHGAAGTERLAVLNLRTKRVAISGVSVSQNEDRHAIVGDELHIFNVYNDDHRDPGKGRYAHPELVKRYSLFELALDTSAAGETGYKGTHMTKTAPGAAGRGDEFTAADRGYLLSLRRDTVKIKDMNTAIIGRALAAAINGNIEAYEAVVGMPKDIIMAYFEAGSANTIYNLPEDIFGQGFGYDVRGNAQPIPGGVVNLTPANLYAIGKLLGTLYAKAGDRALITGDIRLHTPILRYAMTLGLASVGVNTDYSPDYLTTGGHNLLATENEGNYKIVVQVSGSHGIPEKNGFKIKACLNDKKDAKGRMMLDPLYGGALEKLYWKEKPNPAERIEGVRQAAVKRDVAVGSINKLPDQELLNQVIAMLSSRLPDVIQDEIVVIDARAGGAGPTLEGVLKNRGFITPIDMDDVKRAGNPIEELLFRIRDHWGAGERRIAVMLNMKPDGKMGRGIWDPSKPEALKEAKEWVKIINGNLEEGMPQAIGSVFDCDVDRITAIRENGEEVQAFEMTLPYYQRFLLDESNQEVMEAIVRAGGKPIQITCDVRANSKLLGLIDKVNQQLKDRTGIDKNFVEGYYITTGYPPQLGFMQSRIKELNAFVAEHPSLATQIPDFNKKFEHLKNTYFTAEASGHNFFHISARYPDRVCDCAISGLVTLLNIKETMTPAEYPEDAEQGTLTSLFSNFPQAYSSEEIRVKVPNSEKLAIAKAVGGWMFENYRSQLKENKSPVTRNAAGDWVTTKEEGAEYYVQPKDDGFVVVAGFKIQLKDGRTALVRWSNTGEELTTMFEGHDRASLLTIIREITARIKEEISSRGPDIVSKSDTSKLDKEIARIEALSTGTGTHMAKEAPTEFVHTEATIDESSGAGEMARLLAMQRAVIEGTEQKVRHLIIFRNIIPDAELLKSNGLQNLLNTSLKYYDKDYKEGKDQGLEGYKSYVVTSVEDLKVLIGRQGCTALNTIVAVENGDADSLLDDGSIVGRTKILPVQKISEDQFVPVKSLFDLMSVLVNINKPLDEQNAADIELMSYLKAVLANMGAGERGVDRDRYIDGLLKALTVADNFSDPRLFVKNFILKLLPRIRPYEKGELKKLHDAATAVVKSL